jgi:hypothetical protein
MVTGATLSIAESQVFMKRLNGLVLVSTGVLFVMGCGSTGSGEHDDYNGDSDAPEVDFIPAEAASAMRVAETNNLAPKFQACPYYLTYKARSFDANANEVSDWTGIENDLFVIDKPTWSLSGGSVVLVCGTTQSPHGLMSVRKSLPGYTQCTTSALGTENAWFVCT